MPKSRFTEEQIAGILKDAEGERNIREICRKYGISAQTFYKWRATFSGMHSSEVKTMKDLQEENTKLKRLLGVKELELMAVKAVLEKKL